MKEAEFREWLYSQGNNKKLAVDIISRLKRVEKDIGDGNIDEHYNNDRCEKIIRMLSSRGLNDEMAKYSDTKLPIGKKYIAPYRRSVKLYIQFKDQN